MPDSPTSRTLQYLKRNGWRAQVVERYNGHTRRRHDLFGFIDVLAIHSETGQTLAVQATSGANGSTRVDKIVGECHAELCDVLRAGWRVQVWAWRKLKNKGRQQWFPRVTEILFFEGGLIERVISQGE